MEQFTLLFEEYVMKAITMTEKFLGCDLSKDVDIEGFTNNRERLFTIMGQISNQVDWTTVSDEKKTELNRQIDYIKKLDEKLLIKLQEYQLEVKQEIERTVRSKENVKGYNLSDVK